MARFTALAFSLTLLPWCGESLISTQESHQVHRSRNYDHQQPSVASIVSYRRSSSLLHAALSPEHSSPSIQAEGSPKNVVRKKRWHRRILGKISNRGKPSSIPLSSSVEHQEARTGISESYIRYQQQGQKQGKKNDRDTSFVVRNFDKVDPDTVLPIIQVNTEQEISQETSQEISQEISQAFPHKIQNAPPAKPPVIDSAYYDVSITSNTPDIRDATEEPSSTIIQKQTTTTSKRGLVCRFLENFLREKIGEEWPIETPKKLEIDVRSSTDKYNNLGRLLFRQHYRAEATIESDRILFPMIRFSQVKLRMEKVTLNLVEFTKDKSHEDIDGYYAGGNGKNVVATKTPPSSHGRYSKPFDLHIDNLTMTKHDLMFSSSVKNGLRQLLINILKDRGLRSDSIKITSINILPNGKISCLGEAMTHIPAAPPVRFEVRSGISFQNRGHVLTFPGLEVSLNRDLGLFVPVMGIDLDVGHNTQFNGITIDGQNQRISISAKVTITPRRTILTPQEYVQTSDAFSAICFYDVGQWLTRLGRFSK